MNHLEELRSPRAFLTTVLKNLCLNHLQSTRLRKEECVDSLSLEPLAAANLCVPCLPASMADSLTEAFLVLFQRLAPKERVVFLLREVFDCEFEEIATIIKKNAANCRQILRRSRQHITSNHSRFAASRRQLESLTRQFRRSCESGDLEGLISVLS